jgi:rhodanese-related sulfurtransferase
MRKLHSLFLLPLAMFATLAFAQQGQSGQAAGATPQPWTHQTKQLTRAQVDNYLAKPDKVLFIDVRRPDEIVNKGSFPVFLNVQVADLKDNLAFIPKDREIITVSNRAHRAGDVGDILASSGYKVAGAIGSDDYLEQGGTIKKILPPPPRKQ